MQRAAPLLARDAQTPEARPLRGRGRRDFHITPVAAVASALVADVLGAHRVSFYLLLAAIIVLAVATLERVGRVVELSGVAAELTVARFQAALGGIALALALLAGAARAPVLGEATVPPIGLSALVGALGLLLLQGLARLAK